MRDDRAVFIRALERVARSVGSYTAADHNRAGVEFDAMTVRDFLDETLDNGGADSPWGRYVATDMASEFGLDPENLSALNLLFEYIENTPGADERYHVLGGNDQVVAGLAASLPDGAIHLDAPLEAIARLADGTPALSFGGVADPVLADLVVLALPFATLRLVDLSAAGLSRRKLRCIDDLGMGTNAKVAMQFAQRPQAYGHWDGYMLSDDPVLETWESTLATSGKRSVITTYFGGRSGGSDLDSDGPHAPTTAAEVDRNLASLTQGGSMRLPGSTPASTAAPSPITGSMTHGRAVPTRPSFPASTRSTTAIRARRRGRSTSPASTRRPRTRAISRAPSRAASGARGRS